jgi:hypothetical protein
LTCIFIHHLGNIQSIIINLKCFEKVRNNYLG